MYLDFTLENALYDFSELSDYLVELWKDLSGVEAEILLNVLYFLELKSQSDQDGLLCKREINSTLWQKLPGEEELGKSWDKIQYQMEVNQVLGV